MVDICCSNGNDKKVLLTDRPMRLGSMDFKYASRPLLAKSRLPIYKTGQTERLLYSVRGAPYSI